jgi:hypothetical protein
VNSENRGIVVDDEKLGKIEIPWRDFEKVTFSRPSRMRGYDEFKDQKEIRGTITTENGKTISGRIVYDLDEEFTYEVLQGKSDRVEYFIPFSNISKISPRGWNSAILELKSGNQLSLQESQDVSELHQGLLVFTGKSDPVYIRWETIKEIKFY